MIPDGIADGVRVGDHDAFADVYTTMAPPLVDYVYRRVRDRHLAEDLVAEVFVKLWRVHTTIYGNGRQLRRWLYQAALRRIIAHSRSRAAMVHDELDDDLAGGDDPTAVVEHRDELHTVRRHLQTLTPAQADVMRLRIVGFTHPEIACRLGTTPLAAKQLCVRARRRLRAAV